MRISCSLFLFPSPLRFSQAVVASILLWLWRHHQTIFQSAFAKSGRIDVDAQCKWIIHAAVDSAVDALSREAGASGRVGSSPLSGALTSLKAKSNAASSKSVGETDRPSATTSKLDLLITSIVSRALLKGFEVDTQTVRTKIFPLRQFIFFLSRTNDVGESNLTHHLCFSSLLLRIFCFLTSTIY